MGGWSPGGKMVVNHGTFGVQLWICSWQKASFQWWMFSPLKPSQSCGHWPYDHSGRYHHFCWVPSNSQTWQLKSHIYRWFSHFNSPPFMQAFPATFDCWKVKCHFCRWHTFHSHGPGIISHLYGEADDIPVQPPNVPGPLGKWGSVFFFWVGRSIVEVESLADYYWCMGSYGGELVKLTVKLVKPI